VDNHLLKLVDNELRKNIKDEVLKDNLEFLVEVLERNYRILTSFEKYNKEINTDKLNWGPCHSEKFWKEHVKKFELNDFGLVRYVDVLLQEASDSARKCRRDHDFHSCLRFRRILSFPSVCQSVDSGLI
jgi:V-ATPase subunit H